VGEKRRIDLNFGQKLKYFIYQQPATSNQQPATSNQQPATSNQQPATSNQQPATSNQQPATNNKAQWNLLAIGEILQDVRLYITFQ
jgi:hypothetical protein